MSTQINEDVVEYTLHLGKDAIRMNEYIGKEINLEHTGKLICIECNKQTKKFFGQGFCYNCFKDSPENSDCILRPELCEGHLGKGRNAQWEYDHHVQKHYVYLAESGGVKVGVTRTTQVPTRWIDQGAWQALVIAEVPYRKLAGLIEVELKKSYSDKTNWQQMLKDNRMDVDLKNEAGKIKSLLPENLQQYVVENEITQIKYPISKSLEKVNSLSFEKSKTIAGKLVGIKAQYLIFENNDVVNIRSQSGYEINFTSN